MPKEYSIRNLSATECEICLYDVIDPWGDASAKQFQRQLKDAGDKVATIHLRINSPGGSVWEGTAIHSILKAHAAKKIVHIDGIAASMASVIAMAGDEIEMPASACMMIHNPADWIGGEAEQMRKQADRLDQVKEQIVGIYAARSGQDAAVIAKMMDEETWLFGEEAVKLGFADRCVDALPIAACWERSRLSLCKKKLPDALCARLFVTQPEGAKTMAPENATAVKSATVKALRAACPGATDKFILDQFEAEATLEAALRNWQGEQTKRIEELEDKLKAAASRPGSAPPAGKSKTKPAKKGDDDEEEDEEPEDCHDDDVENAIENFDRLVSSEVKSQVAHGRKADRMAAVAAVANKRPTLHQNYLIACGGGRAKVRRLVAEKYDMMPAADGK